ncbi:hypothetical protein HYV83_03680 [Candidatus Woesearchaeota archaeon]|nr:hypothetical protein [Candidatus Woesearchaeota archaeon]
MAKKKTEAKKGSGSSDYKAPASVDAKPKYDASAIEKAAGAAAAGAPIDEFELLASKLPKEAQEKLRDIKVKLDKFKSAALAKFDKYIMGIALLPPPMPQQPVFAPGQLPPTLQSQQIQPESQPQQKNDGTENQQPGQQQVPPADQVSILVLIDDSDSKKMTKDELKKKLQTIIQGMASEIDKKLVVQCLILTELLQNCYDAKYDLLQLIVSWLARSLRAGQLRSQTLTFSLSLTILM